jgi:hypothetical protein
MAYPEPTFLMNRMTFAAIGLLVLSNDRAGHVDTLQDETQALAAVQRLLTGWHDADTVVAGSVLHPMFRLLTLREVGTPQEEIQTDTRDRIQQTVSKLSVGAWEIRLQNPRATVSGDGIATVWGQYQFYIKGKINHCGIESYQLYKVRAGWQIVNFADTHHACSS